MTTSTLRSLGRASTADHEHLIFAAEIDGPFLALSGNWEAAVGRPVSELMRSRRKDLFHPAGGIRRPQNHPLVVAQPCL